MLAPSRGWKAKVEFTTTRKAQCLDWGLYNGLSKHRVLIGLDEFAIKDTRMNDVMNDVMTQRKQKEKKHNNKQYTV